VQPFWPETQTWIAAHQSLILPLLIALWISWSDLKTRKIPNYLTLGAALSGLLYNLACSGLDGLTNGFLGLLLGFGFLILPYILGGMGAGDVKALAALGAWLGPLGTLCLFCYMAIAGGFMSLGVLLWKGLLWQKVLNVILCRDKISALLPAQKIPGIPYGVAMALGMVALMISGSI
jgi:prepilin peptidase CpaA